MNRAPTLARVLSGAARIPLRGRAVFGAGPESLTVIPTATVRSVFGSTGGGATPGQGTSTDPSNPTPTIVFCSDEDIARRAESDFPGLAGDSVELAIGTDGSFASPSTDPWTITSATVPFEAQGVEADDVVQLKFPRVMPAGVTYPTQPRLLAVDVVAGMTITLRRIGLASGMGSPPCPPAGIAAPIHFLVTTLYPQILNASYQIRQTYGLDETIWGRRTEDLYDLLQLTEPCVYRVLMARYLDRARSAGKDGSDDYRAKSDSFRESLGLDADRLALHFKPQGTVPQADLTRFSTRIAR